MSKKLYNLAVKTGVRKDGSYIWKQIGAIMQGELGPYMILDKTFNAAGVESPPGKTAIPVAMFDVKEDDHDEHS